MSEFDYIEEDSADYGASSIDQLNAFDEQGNPFSWGSLFDVQGESKFEKFLDALGTPQQELFGVMTHYKHPEENYLEALARGNKKSLSGHDVVEEWLGRELKWFDSKNPIQSLADLPLNMVGVGLQLTLDPLLAKPVTQVLGEGLKGVKWLVEKPLGLVAKPAYKALSESEGFVSFARKFKRDAFVKDQRVKNVFEEFDAILENLGYTQEEVYKDIVLGDGSLASKAAFEAGEKLGVSAESVEKSIRAIAEYKNMTHLNSLKQRGLFDVPKEYRDVLAEHLNVSRKYLDAHLPKDSPKLIPRGEIGPGSRDIAAMDKALPPIDPVRRSAFEEVDWRQVLPEEASAEWVTSIGKTIDATEEQLKHIPLRLPKDVVAAGLRLKLVNDELIFKELKLGGDTPELKDAVLDYLFHMVTPGAKKQLAAMYEAALGYRKYSPAHASQLSRELKGITVDEANAFYNSVEGLLVGNKRIRNPQIDKWFKNPKLSTDQVLEKIKGLKEGIFETDIRAIEAFRTMRTAKLEANIQMLHAAKTAVGFDAGKVLRDQVGDEIKRLKTQQKAEVKTLLDDLGIENITEIERLPALNPQTKALKDAILTKYYDGLIRINESLGFKEMGTLTDEVRKRIPKGYTTLAFTRSGDERYATLAKYFKDWYFPPEIAGHLNKLIEFNVDPKAAGMFTSFFDKVRATWVAGTLYAFPSTLIKNMVGNVFNSHLAGLNEVQWYTHMRTIQEAVESGKFGKIVIDGAEYDIKKLHSLMKDMGIYGGGYAPQEMANFLARYGKLPWVMRNKYLGGFLREGRIGKLDLKVFGEKRYRQVEDNARGALFLFKHLREGATPLEARGAVKKYLFDYVYGLSDFEKRIRTYVPFLAWSRFNLPMQLRSIYENPLRRTYVRLAELTTLVKSNEAARYVDQFHKTVLPDFVREQVGVPIQQGEDGNPEFFLMGNWIPAAELESIAGSRIFRKAYNMIAPYFRVLPEVAVFNYDPYTKRKISEYPGETQRLLGMDVDRRLVHVSKVFRFANELDGLTTGLMGRDLDKTAASATRKVLRLLFGSPTFISRMDYGEVRRQREIRKLMLRLKYEDSEANQKAIMDRIEELIGE